MGDLLAGIPTEVITGGGLGGIVLLGICLIMTGKLVPGRLHDEVRQDRDKWRLTAETSEKRGDVLSAQLEKLLTQGQTTETLMKAIHQAIERDAEERRYRLRDRPPDRGRGDR